MHVAHLGASCIKWLRSAQATFMGSMVFRLAGTNVGHRWYDRNFVQLQQWTTRLVMWLQSCQ